MRSSRTSYPTASPTPPSSPATKTAKTASSSQGLSRKAGEGAELAYMHQRPNEEELLWLPDILAWAHGAGGDWRRRGSPVIDRVRRLGP